MGDRYAMKAHDGTDPDQRAQWWEGWPLTVVVVLLSAAYWAVKMTSLFG